MLPHCDVLIYTTTQQKYRSARVSDELRQAATGCRLVFVQTHADLDTDIRDDWRRQLEPQFSVPEMFFVDSIRALREQREGSEPSGDFARLRDVLITRLAAAHRLPIRLANVVDLLQAAVDHCHEQLRAALPKLQRIQRALEEQSARLLARMAERLREELLQSRRLWERRLLAAVADRWGGSPFALLLRFYNGLGAWVASLTLLRARTSAQVALIGAYQGARWLTSRRKEREAESHLQRLASLGLDDAVLREAQLVVSGHVREGEMSPDLAEDVPLDALRDQAVRVEDDFLDGATTRIDAVIDQLARQSTGRLTRIVYEFVFLFYVIFVLFRIGENFFYGSFIKPMLGKPADPLLSVDFYIPAILFFVLWSGGLVLFLTRQLRRGLESRIAALAHQLAQNRLAHGLFPDLEQACRQAQQQCKQLED
ncbi:MAG TPA: hypothetical protein EYP14_20825, partial [Planctomycetaceae bacterium]|nr:hypothetical protein [Planctomycetaceae bacterium]